MAVDKMKDLIVTQANKHELGETCETLRMNNGIEKSKMNERKNKHSKQSVKLRSYSIKTTFLVYILILGTLSYCANAKSFFIVWDTVNPTFQNDSDNVFEVNKLTGPFEYDQLNIICSRFENHIIYNVSKTEYDTCKIINPTPHIIAICDYKNDKQKQYSKYTITFRPISVRPGGMEFKSGNYYYFISTSSPDDLYNLEGGDCSTHNMRALFMIYRRNEETLNDNRHEELTTIQTTTPSKQRPNFRDVVLKNDNNLRELTTVQTQSKRAF